MLILGQSHDASGGAHRREIATDASGRLRVGSYSARAIVTGDGSTTIDLTPRRVTSDLLSPSPATTPPGPAAGFVCLDAGEVETTDELGNSVARTYDAHEGIALSIASIRAASGQRVEVYW